ncbi:MAG: hypothetical protein ACRDN0_18145 [Trebonia sp.]
MCTHNAGRSQMAAALLSSRSGGRVEVASAGSAPASSLNPAVVEAMAEIGLAPGPRARADGSRLPVADSSVDAVVDTGSCLTRMLMKPTIRDTCTNR